MPYLNMHCGQPSLMVRYGTGYNVGTGHVRSRVIRHRLPPWWRQKKHRDVINFSILLFFFQAYPGIRTRTIALHAFPPYTSHSYPFFQVASRYDLAFESPIWIVRPAACGQLCLMIRYGTVRDRYGIAPGVTQTNKQTHKHQTRELGRSGPYAMLFCLLIMHVTCQSCVDPG